MTKNTARNNKWKEENPTYAQEYRRLMRVHINAAKRDYYRNNKARVRQYPSHRSNKHGTRDDNNG